MASMVNRIGVAYSSLGGLRFLGGGAALPTGAVIHCDQYKDPCAGRRLAWDASPRGEQEKGQRRAARLSRPLSGSSLRCPNSFGPATKID